MKICIAVVAVVLACNAYQSKPNRGLAVDEPTSTGSAANVGVTSSSSEDTLAISNTHAGETVAAENSVIITEISHDGGWFHIPIMPQADVDGMKPRDVVAASLRLIKEGKTEPASKYWTIFDSESRQAYASITGTYSEFCAKFQSYDQVELCAMGRSKGHYLVWMKCRRDGIVVEGDCFSVDKKYDRWLISRWTHW